MSLSDKKCVPCEGGVTPLSAEEIEKLLQDLDDWTLSEKGVSIARSIKFKNFKESLAFVNKVGDLAEEEGHHPDFTFGWGYCHVVLMTHAINGLHENDFIIAAKIDKLLK